MSQTAPLLLLIIIFLPKLTLENPVDEINVLATTMALLSLVGKAFGEFGKKMSFSAISRFEVVES